MNIDIPDLRLTKYIKFEPTMKQCRFLLSKKEEVFFGGAAGPGKSIGLLMAALQYVDIPGYNAIILRNTYSNLSKPEGLMDVAAEWLAGTDAVWSEKIKGYKFDVGSTLTFGYLEGPKDHFNYQGPAYQFVGIDEVVQIRENQATYLFSRMRKLKAKSFLNKLRKLDRYKKYSEKQLKEFYNVYSQLPMRFRCTSNPPAPEQVATGAWVKERYITNGNTSDRIFISARLGDNPHLDREEYIKSLNKLDPITRMQLLEGDWNVRVKGRMFDRSWFKVVEAIPVDESDVVRTVRYWDMASTEPSQTNKDPDYTVGVKMILTNGGLYYITSVIRFRKSPSNNEKIIRQVADIDGKEVEIYMEQEPGSSGKSQIDHYRRNILPEFYFKSDKVTGSKRKRAMPYASQAEAGNIILVNSGPWIVPFVEEHEVFPDGAHDDQVDAASGAFDKLAGSRVEPNLRVV
jgi:predicted phage terminase large subunit-like protein